MSAAPLDPSAGRTVAVVFDKPLLRTIFRPAIDALEAGGATVHLVAALDAIEPAVRAEADVLIAAGHLAVSGDDLADWPKLRALVSPFTGFEGFDAPGVTARGILIANGQARENTESTAEATILLMLAAWYDLSGTEAVLRRDIPRAMPPRARMVAGKTIGIIGYGDIAKAVVRKLAGWGVDILIHTRTVPDTAPEGVRFAALDEVVAAADILMVLAALNPSTRHMFHAARLARLKPDCLFVNTSRGGLVDEAALAEILAARTQMRAALDVFEVEPLPADSPLRDLPNAILTQHMLSHTRDSIEAMPKLLLANVQAVLAGELPPCTRNPEIAEAWVQRWS
ncbi:NAD(P)-dependent oxidoreductase [Sphingomonas naphthae]|uniref:NAD(P)-dependent oxidoreductase n=1 Tax=Sphingomonas naphthae TaxID=1813468 RepID=A0ABY7TM98_9SPHN|nr:NAD(P)-dependent oxidoreductase [Sphingomonas naphthae]WCT74357.1 NAD(P)-dependent oxidoreductase [Sphingomonas naphthae]